jgi:hypothetical protein
MMQLKKSIMLDIFFCHIVTNLIHGGSIPFTAEGNSSMNIISQ